MDFTIANKLMGIANNTKITWTFSSLIQNAAKLGIININTGNAIQWSMQHIDKQIDNLSLKASDFYTKQVNAIVDRLTSLIEPLLIVLVGVVIGGVIVVTYLPIFNFGSALAK